MFSETAIRPHSESLEYLVSLKLTDPDQGASRLEYIIVHENGNTNLELSGKIRPPISSSLTIRAAAEEIVGG